MESIWSRETAIAGRVFLDGDRNTQACVIGAGIAGILTAYFLQKRGVETVVIDAGRIAGGVTRNTTAKVTSQHGLIYNRLVETCGLDQAADYARANQRAIQDFADVVRKESIDCDFRWLPNYVYSLDDCTKLKKEVDAARRLGLPASYTEHTELPFCVAGAVRFDHQAQMQPLSLIAGLCRRLEIYENTPALAVRDNVVETPRGKIRAEHIFVTTHFPFINQPGYYFMRMYQQRSYVIALESAQELSGMYVGAEAGGFSLRKYKNLVLFGGAGHRSGVHQDYSCYDSLLAAARRFYPHCREVARWSAQDCITLDQIPYIGRYSARTSRMFVATGFGKWGMTGSMVAARVLSDLAVGKDRPEYRVFSPQRLHLGASAKNLSQDVYQAVRGVSEERFRRADRLPETVEAGQAAVVVRDGKKLGLYRTEAGEEFYVPLKCPHMGCELHWNPDERTWDCPCHGSRFDVTGRLLDNPATVDLRGGN